MSPAHENPEEREMQRLLEEVRRTLHENRLFIQKLKDEDEDLETGEDDAEEELEGEDFEEL
jgi:hypothetical protein